MQIAAANPSYLNREAVPAEAIENEKKIIIVNAYVNATAKKLGGDIKIVEYTHFIKGEGLEKRVDDFAAEVAAAVKG